MRGQDAGSLRIGSRYGDDRGRSLRADPGRLDGSGLQSVSASLGRNPLRVRYRSGEMEGSDFRPGLEGVVAFETEIAEPDKEGNALRYRGVDIEDLVGRVSFGNVWGLLVDNEFNPGLPPAEPFPLPVHSGDVRVDVQSALAMLAPAWGFRQLLDIEPEEARNNLARASVMALSF